MQKKQPKWRRAQAGEQQQLVVKWVGVAVCWFEMKWSVLSLSFRCQATSKKSQIFPHSFHRPSCNPYANATLFFCLSFLLPFEIDVYVFINFSDFFRIN